MALEQDLATNTVQAFDFAVNESTHQWVRIPLGGSYFAYKNVATGNLLEHWDHKQGSGDTVAMRDAINDPKCQWFESRYVYDDIFIGLRNRSSRLYIDHYGSREIQTSAEDLRYLERHWCLIYHHRPRTMAEIVTLENVEFEYLLQQTKGTESYDTWQRIPASEGCFIYKNTGTGMVLSLNHESVNLVDGDGQDPAQQWRECDIGGGQVALQNRAFATMLRSSGPDEIDARNNNIEDSSDLWRIKLVQPVETSNDDPSWMIQPNELSCQSEAAADGIYNAKWAFTDVTVKEMKNEEDVDQFQREVKLWSELRHNNIGRFYGANLTTEPYFVVSERVETLDGYIAREKPEPKRVYELMFQAAAGLRYLHNRNIVHGDLNGRNIGVNQHGVAVLTGFGLSESGNGSNEEEQSAPQHKPTFQGDIFSLGMCFVAATSGTEYPWCNCKHVDIRKCYEARGSLKRRPHCTNEEQWGLLTKMLVFEAEERSNLDHVLEMLANFASDGDENTLNADIGQESAEEEVSVQAEEGVLGCNDSASWKKSWEFVQEESD